MGFKLTFCCNSPFQTSSNNKYLCISQKTKLRLRYFLKLSYKGTAYHGWQIQPNAQSVQEVLQNALQTVLRSEISVVAAGRTDTGVHAKIMYAHFDLDNLPYEIQICIFKLNSLLPKDIAVIDIFTVAEDAHARFDAKKRTYEYHINQHKNPFDTEGSWYFRHTLDLELMNKAAEILLLKTDFESFSKVHTEVNNFRCKITKALWERSEDSLIFTISADRFLRNMVRAIVGTLINVGTHKITLAEFETIIDSKNRSEAGFSVPAHGLYLTAVDYDYIPV